MGLYAGRPTPLTTARGYCCILPCYYPMCRIASQTKWKWNQYFFLSLPLSWRTGTCLWRTVKPWGSLPYWVLSMFLVLCMCRSYCLVFCESLCIILDKEGLAQNLMTVYKGGWFVMWVWDSGPVLGEGKLANHLLHFIFLKWNWESRLELQWYAAYKNVIFVTRLLLPILNLFFCLIMFIVV